jgi:hypothetical protein
MEWLAILAEKVFSGLGFLIGHGVSVAGEKAVGIMYPENWTGH